jgi:hypothetical protein
MRFREIYTVTRESKSFDLCLAQEQAKWTADDPEGSLYGASGEETVQVRFEVQYTDDGPWLDFELQPDT